MVKDALVKCSECSIGFSEGNTIMVCPECDEIFCENCWEEHNCIEDDYAEVELECSECKRMCDSSELKTCSHCDDNVCDDCWTDHSKNHLKESVEEYDYEEYVDEKVSEAI